MKRIKVKLLCLFLLLVFLSYSHQNTGKLSENGVDAVPAAAQLNPQRLTVDADFGKIPLYFVANVGQAHRRARYFAKAAGYTLWLTAAGLVFDSTRKKKNQHDDSGGKTESAGIKALPDEEIGESYERDVSRLFFQNANPDPEITIVEPTNHRVNYMIGSDREGWKTDISTSKCVLYRDLYKNVDLKVYGIEKKIEYDWLVKPGGNPGNIVFSYRGTNGTEIKENGDLLIHTEFGELIHKKPVSYQVIDSQKIAVDSSFMRLGKNTYGFEVGDYDEAIDLIIDPVVLVFSTYLGGLSSDRGEGIFVDNSGNVYITGRTFSLDYPVQNAYQGYSGSYDVFVTKLAVAGNSLVYSTYLGGDDEDWGQDIQVDGSGNAYVTGYTRSNNYPLQNPFQTYQGNYDAFVSKLSPAGSSLVYSTCLGGSSFDLAFGIAVDGEGHAYVIGQSYSDDFPLLSPYQNYRVGNYDVFVTKLTTTGDGLIYSTYLGGSSDEHVVAIAVDSSGKAYVTGHTRSSNFPAYLPYQSYSGADDVFVSKLSSAGSSLIYSTFLGGTSGDWVDGIAIDSSGCAYVCGQTGSSDFPTKDPFQSNLQGDKDTFVTKIAELGNSLVYSTYLGGSLFDNCGGIAVDSFGQAYVTGLTWSPDFPVQNRYQAYQGNVDVFITKLSAAGDSLPFSTLFGGSDDDVGNAIAVDDSGGIYVTGYTLSPDLPTLNPLQARQSSHDVFAVKLLFNDTNQITVNPPNGGESWTPGSLQNINWTSVGDFSSVDIEYSIDNGGSWSLIASATDNDGSHYWTVPNTPSSQCLVRVSDSADSNTTDSSDAVFTISAPPAPTLTVVSPNGGEVWNAGSVRNISWTNPAAPIGAAVTPGPLNGAVRIEYSTNNGNTWQTVVASTDIDRDYAWTIPDTPSSLCLIRVTQIAYSYNFDISDSVFTITSLLVHKDDLLGSWTGQGVYYRNSDDGSWQALATPAVQVTCGDLDHDGIDDLIGKWPAQGGWWIKYSSTGQWALVSGSANWIRTGDMNGDGLIDLLGSWNGQGVFVKDAVTSRWTLLATMADQIAAGDLDGDGTDDLIGIWPLQGGVWVKYSRSQAWVQLAGTADWIAVGDISGSNRDDLVGSWPGQGVYYRNSFTWGWNYLATPATQITCGDLDGDGRDDLIGLWSGQGGVWARYTGTEQWELLSSTADWIGAGKMRQVGLRPSRLKEQQSSKLHSAIFMDGPDLNGDYLDFSDTSPGGSKFIYIRSRNIHPGEKIDEEQQAEVRFRKSQNRKEIKKS